MAPTTTETKFIAQVRAKLGKVANTVDIDDSDILNEANNILSNYFFSAFPKKVLRFITTEANVSEYSVAPTTVRVQKIVPSAIVDELDLGSAIVPNSGVSPLRTEEWEFPSLRVIRAMRTNRGLQTYQFDFNPVERKLKLYPTPTSSDVKVYYISTESPGWTIDTVPEDFWDLLVVGTTWRCLEIVFLRRSTEGGILREGGRVDYPAAMLKGYVESNKQEFFDLLNLKAKLYML